MDLPVRFPSETEVILEDVARFRALPPEHRMGAIRGLLNASARIMRTSPKAAWARQFARDQEELARRNIREFIERHAQ